MSRHRPAPVTITLPPGVRIGVVAARFNAHIVDVLLEGCLARLTQLGATPDNVLVRRVPGAFELPVAALWLARRARVDAVICLGCVISGETAHFEFVAGQSARGIMDVSLATGVATIFGVLTTHTEAQALDRAGGTHGHAGESAADTAAEMVMLARSIPT